MSRGMMRRERRVTEKEGIMRVRIKMRLRDK